MNDNFNGDGFFETQDSNAAKEPPQYQNTIENEQPQQSQGVNGYAQPQLNQVGINPPIQQPVQQQPISQPLPPYGQPQGGFAPMFNGQNGMPYMQNGGFLNEQFQNMYYPPANPYTVPLPPPTKKKMKKGVKALLITACTVASAAIILVVVALAMSINDIPEKDDIFPDTSQNPFSSQKPPEASANPNGPQISVKDPPSDEDNVAIGVYKAVSPSVVGITVYESGVASGEGSGIIISEDGYIATNSHVVDDSKDSGVVVRLSSGKEYIGAVVGYDIRTDLAVVKIDAKGLSVADFADSDKVVVGQTAFAIGNPGGLQFSNSLTQGTVSATERMIDSTANVKYIQTDAAINPGNSGGALINIHGQIIGINTAKIVGEEYEGMGFAIPSNTVINIVNNIIRNGYVKGRASLGASGMDCTAYMAETKGVPQGVIISSINLDSAFSGKDVIINDIITKIDDKEITNCDELLDVISAYSPKDEATVTLYRPKESTGKSSGKYYTVKIRFIEDDGQSK